MTSPYCVLHRPGAPTHTFRLGEPTGSKARPVLCYKTAKAACTAKYLTDFKEGGLPKGTERMLLLLEVGFAGEGTDSILASGASGQLSISRATPIKLCPLPTAAAASTQPRACSGIARSIASRIPFQFLLPHLARRPHLFATPSQVRASGCPRVGNRHPSPSPHPRLRPSPCLEREHPRR